MSRCCGLCQRIHEPSESRARFHPQPSRKGTSEPSGAQPTGAMKSCRAKINPQRMLFDPASGVRYLRRVALHRLTTRIPKTFSFCAALLIIGVGCKSSPHLQAPPAQRSARSFAASSAASIPSPPLPPGMAPQEMTFDVPVPPAGPGLTIYPGAGFVGIGLGPSFGSIVKLQKSTNLIDWATIFEGDGPVLYVDFEPPPTCFYRLNY